MPSSQWNTYWDKPAETRSRSKNEKAHLALLKKQISYAWKSSEFYQSRFAKHGVHPTQLRSLDDLQRFPFLYKRQLSPSTSTPYLTGPHQCAPSDDIVRIVGTGGTSGKPHRIGWTRADIAAYNTMGARAAWSIGVRPHHTVVNCFNYRLYAGGVMDHGAFETLGAKVIAYGVGKSSQLLELLSDLPGPICLYSTPSYAISLISKAKDLGVALPDLNVDMGVFSGEIGLQSPIVRDKIESAWQLHAGDLYGVAELGCQAAECEHKAGLHFFGHDYVHLEMIDPVTWENIPIQNGAIGELVYTSLTRQSCPLIRWRSGDLCAIETDICKCGRASPRITVMGRSDDMVIVGGVNVFPASIQSLLIDFGFGVTGEFSLEKHNIANLNIAASKTHVAHVAHVAQDDLLQHRPILYVERQGSNATCIGQEHDSSVTIQSVDLGAEADRQTKDRLTKSNQTKNDQIEDKICADIRDMLKQKLDVTFIVRIVSKNYTDTKNHSSQEQTKAVRIIKNSQ